MKTMKFRPGTAVSLTWSDSLIRTGWQRPQLKYKTGRINTLGYVVACDEEAVTVTTSAGEGVVICPLVIPWVSVTRAEAVGEPWDAPEDA